MKCVKDAGCIEGSCGHVVRLQTCYTGIYCLIRVVCDSTVTVLCVCVWRHDHIQKGHQNRTWKIVEVDIIRFVLRSWRSESCTEY